MSELAQASTRSAAYFDLYWRQRFNPASYRRRLNSLVRNYSSYLPAPPARVIEIGPGFGELLELLRDRHLDVEAVDIDAELIEALRARGFDGVHAVEDTMAYLRSRAGVFHCVVALHVLEHFEPAAGADLLAAAYEALTPGGRIIIEVPNMANFITAPYARWADYTHRTGFTQESLGAALGAAGFAVERTFGVARPVRSFSELAAWCGQFLTQSIVWTLLKANYPQARIVAAPAISAIGVKAVARR